MSIVALIPVAQMAAANLALEEAGFGPGNFSVPAYGATGVTHAALHAWEDSAFREALALVPGVVVGDPEDEGDPITLTAALIAAQGAKWGAQLPELPATGAVAKDSMWRWGDDILIALQAFNRTTYPADPYTYPALLARVHEPGERRQWKQPGYAFDTYRLVNPFSGKADECIYNGKTWRTKIDFNVTTPAAGQNWLEIAADGSVIVPPEWPDWVQPTGGHDAYALGAKVTYQGQRWVSDYAANVWAPGVFGWILFEETP
jgi:hypothetical protein